LGPAIVSVEAWFGDQHADFAFGHHGKRSIVADAFARRLGQSPAPPSTRGQHEGADRTPSWGGDLLQRIPPTLCPSWCAFLRPGRWRSLSRVVLVQVKDQRPFRFCCM